MFDATQPRPGDVGLTVAECLRLTPLDQGRVLSGHGGLGRKVRWVHVVDHSDPEDSLADGELLLTSGIALSQDAPLRAQIFGIMQRHNSAGLVIALGRYMPDVPDAMLRAGDASGIPVIGLPWAVNFGDITRALLTPLVHAHYRYLERAEELGRELLDMLLHRAGLPELCERVAATLGRPVAVFDAGGRPRAASAGFPRAAEITAALPGTGTRHLVAGGRLLGIALPLGARGTMVMDGAPGPLPRGGLLMADNASAALALHLAQEAEVAAASRRHLDQGLLEALEGGGPIGPALVRQLGLLPEQPCTVLLVEPRDGDRPGAFQAAAGALARLFAVRPGVPVGPGGAFLLQRPLGRAKSWAERLAASLAESGQPCRIALGPPDRPLAEAAAGFAAAREALRLGRMLRPKADLLPAGQAVMLARLAAGLPQGGDPAATSPAIAALEEQDRSLHGSLVATLECLLEADGNGSLAARQLGIHRHTLLYRLGRIRDIIGTELDSATRLELRLQLMAWRLAGR